MNSCKKDVVVEDIDFSGEYTGTVTAVGRYPCTTTSTEGFLDAFGYFVDTSTNKCCNKLLNSGDCPDVYTIHRLDIFKHNDSFFLKNVIRHNLDGTRLSFDFPMILRNDSLIFDSRISNLRNNYFLLENYNYSDYPKYMELLGFSMNISDEHFGKGRWTFMKEWSISSSGGSASCMNIEFSDFVFERRE
jgi:hypothetical protein